MILILVGSKSDEEIVTNAIGGVEEAGLTQEFILIGHVIDTDIKDTICDKVRQRSVRTQKGHWN